MSSTPAVARRDLAPGAAWRDLGGAATSAPGPGSAGLPLRHPGSAATSAPDPGSAATSAPGSSLTAILARRPPWLGGHLGVVSWVGVDFVIGVAFRGVTATVVTQRTRPHAERPPIRRHGRASWPGF